MPAFAMPSQVLSMLDWQEVARRNFGEKVDEHCIVVYSEANRMAIEAAEPAA